MSDSEGFGGFECWVQVSTDDQSGGQIAEGWVFTQDNHKIERIRAIASGRKWPGVYGLARPDVALAFPSATGAESCGFHVKLPNAVAAGALQLEAKIGAEWQTFFSTGSSAGPTLNWFEYARARIKTRTGLPTPSRFEGLGQGYVCWVDQPTNWRKVDRRFLLSGWCFTKSGSPIANLRVCIGSQSFPVRRGLSRPDVVAVYGNRPGTLESGFEVTVEMAGSNFAILRLEATDPDGRWREVFRKRISSRPGKGGTSTDRSYEAWIKRYDTLSSRDRAGIRDQIRSFQIQPRFDILMTISDLAVDRVEASLKSVRAQLYPNWQLRVAPTKPDSDRVSRVLSRYAKHDRRIRIVPDPKGAEGDFCARLYGGDRLAPTALYFCAHEINQCPDVQLIYSDEDQLDAAGHRAKPHFKPDWNATLFLEQNYVSQLTVLRTALAKAMGLRNDLAEVAEDSVLHRNLEEIQSSQIRHSPWVLYHRHGKVIENTTSQCGFPRAHSGDPLVSIIIPTRDWVHLLEPCVTSILEKTTYPNFEIIIVDNGSCEPAALDYLAAVARERRVRVLRRDEEFNYSRLNNVAVQSSEAEFVALVNNDIVVSSPEWLDEMVSRAMSPNVGAVGPRLLYPDGRIQQAGVILGAGLHGVAEVAHRGLPKRDPGYFGRARCAQELSAVGAACMLVRRRVYLEVDGFDEERLKVAFNDIDFCLKLRAKGYRIIYTPEAELYHLEHASRGHENTEGKKLRFDAEIQYMKEKWGEALLSDPAYNPNLSLGPELFTLAFPPRVMKPWRTN